MGVFSENRLKIRGMKLLVARGRDGKRVDGMLKAGAQGGTDAGVLLMVKDSDVRVLAREPIGAGARVVRAAVVDQQDFVGPRQSREINVPGRRHFFHFSSGIEGGQDGRKRGVSDGRTCREFGHGLIPE
jgi:hypothetical protein